ncbi:hypothetical protein QTJ16_005137 [Diplocarpon rosae]|uniref:Uncharacterized protein n=1 Tax=Diplocarpon rosae TaxID=946125 RepID=A0AAD9SY74_9HELO|nr:hypothetical protein QTJ16_005137 [Diplocarpon rosae]PBP21477.1 hypothetical protein BUE80_DR007720 [Diplocarpon rosae]
MNIAHKSQERAFALQKYLLLHSQHDALQKHLSQITTSFPSNVTSPSHSPSRSRFPSVSSPGSDGMPMSPSQPPHAITYQGSPHHQRGGSVSRPTQRPLLRHRRSSLPSVVDESILGEIDEDVHKLKDVNLAIKQTLTELLNCESVRNDNKYRMWVQSRLMDAEKELKVSRTRNCERRRSDDVNGGMMF